MPPDVKIQPMQKSLVRFENAIKSEQTKKVYAYYLRKFLQFAKIMDYDGLLQLKDSFLQGTLEEYLFYLKKTISPNSLSPRFAALELFFAMNDKILNFKKIRKMFPSTVKRAGRDSWPTEDIQKMLASSKSKRMKSIIHFVASTGCRVGVLPELKIKHVIDIESCKAVKLYEGTNEEYWGFLTPEASKALNDYLIKRKNDGEILTSDSPLFRKSYRIGSAKARPLTVNSLTRSFVYLIKEANANRFKEGQRHNIARFHGFRKRFNTILKDSPKGNIALKEKLMGHKGVFALDGTYHTPRMETLFEEFKNHIFELTIDDSERLRVKHQELEATKIQQESKIEEIEQKVQAHDVLMENLSGLLTSIRKLTGKPNLFKSLEVGYVPDPNKRRPPIGSLSREDDDRPFSIQERSIS